MDSLFEILAEALRPNIKIRQCLDGPGGYMMGEDSIEIGDKFCGYACGYFFDNQKCTSIEDNFIYGTTTLAVFKKENILKLKNK